MSLDASDGRSGPAAWTRERRRRAWQLVARFGRAHRRRLWRGVAWTLAVVAFRLALPWPLRSIVESAYRPEGAALGPLGETAFVVLAWGVAYLACATGAGYSEMGQRVSMMQFASHVVSGVRAAATRGVARSDARAGGSGELVARLVGDGARLKAGLSGVLVHLSQNGLLFLGVTLVTLCFSPLLGSFFVVGGLLTLAVSLSGARAVARLASRHRHYEGQYAEVLAGGVMSDDLDVLNDESQDKDVKTTRAMARTTLLVHVVMGMTTAAALVVGVVATRAGQLAAGEVFVFIAYALIVHRRMVQVGRQTARLGKLYAVADRLAELVDAPEPRPAAALLRNLSLDGIRVVSSIDRKARKRLRRADVELSLGQRVAVVGKSGSGKSTLLRIVSGVESPSRGRLLADGVEVDPAALRSSVAYLARGVGFPRQELWRTLGLSHPLEPDGDVRALLDDLGVSRIVAKYPKGLLQKACSVDLSADEGIRLKLASLLSSSTRPVWVLDDVFNGWPKKDAKRALRAAFARSTGRLLVVSISDERLLDDFDRVISMRKGKVVFDGSVAEFQSDPTDDEEKDLDASDHTCRRAG